MTTDLQEISKIPLRMPGATLITRLKVYDTPTPDGQIGGTPHFHFLCTEMYFVLEGSGKVEMIDSSGFSVVELQPYSALIFSPGTIHRLINPDGNLHLLVIMQNSGLPEHGDNMVTFPQAILADESQFTEIMTAKTVEQAYRRRDKGVAGFLELKAAFERGLEHGQTALSALYESATTLMQPKMPQWRAIVEKGALAAATDSIAHINSVQQGDAQFLLASQQHLITSGPFDKPGFCGHLNRYFDPFALHMDGIESG